MQRVTWLEPRTPHQPGKLQKLSKNEFVLLLSFLESIKKTLFYLLENQSSAGCPQPPAAFPVQCVKMIALFSASSSDFRRVEQPQRKNWPRA